MRKFHFKAYLGVRFAENLTNRELKSVYSEIERLTEYYKLTFDNKVIVDKVLFFFAENPKEIEDVNKKFEWVFTDQVLIIEFESDSDNFSKNRLSVGYFVEKRIRDLVIAISIAKKGGIDIGEGARVFINGEYKAKFSSVIHNIGASIERANAIKWPKLKILDLEQTINWLNKYQNKTDSLSNDKISRALNAYSYLFKTRGGDDNASELFWAMVGIESIYAEGNANIVNQVNLKSQIFLGKRKEFKKSFNEMYDYRSRFVHGDLDFINNFVLRDNTEEVFKHWTDLGENQDLATAVLIATFQKLIVSNWTSLDFEYKVVKISNLKE